MTNLSDISEPVSLVMVIGFVLTAIVLAIAGSVFLGRVLLKMRAEGRVRTETVRSWDIIPAVFLANLYFLLWILSVVAALQQADAPSEPAQLSYGGLLIQMGLMAFILFVIFAFISFGKARIGYFFGIDLAGPGTVLKISLGYLLAGLPAILVISSLWNLMLTYLLELQVQAQEVVDMFVNADSVLDRVLLTLLASVIAPVTEELIFRGYLYQVAKRYIGFLGSMILISILFALIHVSLAAFVPLFLLAILLTLSYERTGSIMAPIVMHAIFNTFMISQLWFVDPSAFPQ